ncbi:diaminopimelate decarboxylase [Chryseolinea lacunae]|uniref:Diaminopimelate decarboxylase n=1 Tax=Chryseolinea lacunae TaxID=2801331 RepID=A0ABS1KR51_9BACT|nr:diaminopimelate decarboxylase [Chryseolinea lacunae]MBL0741944.1 diaminopimelate decarboxylase [Chryseolinea lacunae]
MDLLNGTYSIQGIPALDIAKQFGTPLYVYDADKIGQQIKNLKNAFSGADVNVKYAAKALTNISILKLIRKNGAGIEVVSLQEAHIALKAGFTPTEIVFTPSGVDFSEIVEGVSLGLGINLDNLSVLQKFGEKYKNTYPCGIRLNPHIMAGGNLKISTGHSNSKFGISVQQIDLIKDIVKTHDVKIRGLHVHTGSEITETDVFLKMADVLFSVANDFPDLKFIDFGSGFKVAYKEGDKVTNVNDVGAQLTKIFNEFCQHYGRKLELWVEPGKYIVSESGTLLVQANVVKATPTVTFVGVNSGLNHLIRPMMYEAYHHIVNVSNPAAPEKVYTVVGYICETDTFGADRKLSEVREGDILALKNAGAYGFSMSSNYNSRPRPAEVMVINGQAKLIRERETLEDIMKRQIEIDV